MAESRAKAMLRDEFLINMQKFASSITRTLQQIEGEVRLDVPEVEIPENIDEVLNNKDLMDLISERCAEWARQIQVGVNTYNSQHDAVRLVLSIHWFWTCMKNYWSCIFT